MHADTIDPKLDEDFDTDGAIADGSVSPLLSPTGVAAAGTGSTGVASAGNAATDTVTQGHLPTLPADHTFSQRNKPTDNLQSVDFVGVGQDESTAAASAASAPAPAPPAPAPVPAAAAVTTVAVAGDQRPLKAGGAGTGELLQGSLMGAGGIPSNPVLAMQMGAQMALTGKLNAVDSYNR